MKTFGFRKPVENHWFRNFLQKIFKNISFLYLTLLLVSFFGFIVANDFSQVVKAKDNPNLLNKSFEDLALYSWPVDKSFSDFFFSLETVKNNYDQEKNIFKENKGDLIYISNFLKQNKSKILNLVPKQYKDFTTFLIKSLDYRQELFRLAGSQGVRKYLVILQNNSEVRPNGGFFGSYGVVKFKGGQLQNIKILDSYRFRYNYPDVKFEIQDWAQDMFSKSTSGLISSNKFGFSDIDGKNILKLYNKAHKKEKAHGVVFVQSKMFADLIPNFQKKLWKRQFINASIDLIRGKDLTNKKEIYLDQANGLIDRKKGNIFKQLIKDFEKIKKKEYISVYFPDISKDFKKYLTNKGFISQYQKDKIYVFNQNMSYNKVDTFLTKNVELWQDDEIISENSGNVDTLKMSNLSTGTYNLNIYNNFNIPSRYLDFINGLKEKYDINLTNREKHILGLDPVWNNWIYIYLPRKVDIKEINIDKYVYDKKLFRSPFAKIIKLKAKFKGNHKVNRINIKLKK